eukprot:scaffold299289_cov37-Prasinocladus_malaysianus.AAC.1
MNNVASSNIAIALSGRIRLIIFVRRDYRHTAIDPQRFHCCGKVNAVAPGFIKSDMTAAIDPKYEGAILSQIPLGELYMALIML